VLVRGAQWAEAGAAAEELAGASGGVLIHPFDDPILWEGHATLVHEVSESLGGRAPGAIVASVGGGGLLLGVLRGLQDVGWEREVTAVACETEGANALALSVEAGHQVHLHEITSIAKSLGSPYPSAALLERCLREPRAVRPWVCSDRQAVSACLRFAEDHRILVEPACGAALAAVYERSPELASAESVLVVVCGGAIASPRMMEEWREHVGL